MMFRSGSRAFVATMVSAVFCLSLFLVSSFEVAAADWSAPEVIGSGTGAYVSDPSFAENSVGQEIVAWTEWTTNGTNASIWANLFTPGTGWSGATEISDATLNAGSATAGIDSEGVCTVAWTDGDSVFSMDYDPGSGWQIPVTVANVSGRWVYNLRFVEAPTGDAMAVWSVDMWSWNNPTYMSYRPAFSDWSLPALFPGPSDVWSYFDMAIDDQGNVLTVFSNYTGGTYRMSANGYVKGVGWSGLEQLSDDPGSGYSPSLSMNSNGMAVVGWQQFEGSPVGQSVPYVNMYSPSDGWANASDLETAPNAGCDSVSVALGEDGAAVAVWRFIVPNATSSFLRTARYIPGVGWGAPETINGSTDGLNACVSIGPTGVTYISWIGIDWANSSFNTSSRIFVAHYNDSAGWEPAALIATGNVTSIGIQAERDGGALVIFSGEISGRNVFVSRLSGPKLPPVASVKTHSAMGDSSTLFQFDASTSTDSQTPPWGLQFRWDWNGDGLWDTSWTSSPSATHKFDAPNSYAVRVQVMDGDGMTDVASVSVTVTAVVPEFSSMVPIVLVLAVSLIIAGSNARHRRTQSRLR